MRALSFLIIRRLKNRIISLKNKPGMLILYGIILIFVVFSVVMAALFGNNSQQQMHFADERIIFLAIAGFGILYLGIFISTGLSTGSTLFSMADVGLLFVAPISSKKILMYGLLSTLGKSLLASVFIFYQIGNLRINFGYGMKEIWALFIIFAVMVLFCQLLSIGIYIFSNGNPLRKQIVKGILYGAGAVLIIAVFFIQRQEQVSIIEAVLRTVEKSWFGYIPVAGWMTMFFIGIVRGSIFSVIVASALFLVFGILIISLLTTGAADYYEDVLLSTEVTYQTQTAAKEGRNVPRRSNKKIKVSDVDQGIARGSGAMTIFYKHLLEMRRKSRFIFIDGFTMIAAAAVGIAGYNFRNIHEAAYGVLATAIYMQFFLTMMGRLRQELIKPYIYLIPAKSLNKVFAASLTSLLKPFVDGICMFAVYTVVGGTDPFTAFFLAFAYGASGAVFTGITILYQRVLGGQPNKVVQMLIGMMLLFAIMAPSIGASVAAAFLLPSSLDFLCTLPYSVFCLMFAALLFVTCGNLIDKAEYSGKF